MNRLSGWLMAICLVAAIAAPTGAAEMEALTPATETADRELIVRFARAYGMVLGTAPDGEDPDAVRHPESLPGERRDELRQILADGGLTEDEWRAMFARMDDDPALRERVDSLSIPFRIQ